MSVLGGGPAPACLRFYLDVLSQVCSGDRPEFGHSKWPFSTALEPPSSLCPHSPRGVGLSQEGHTCLWPQGGGRTSWEEPRRLPWLSWIVATSIEAQARPSSRPLRLPTCFPLVASFRTQPSDFRPLRPLLLLCSMTSATSHQLPSWSVTLFFLGHLLLLDSGTSHSAFSVSLAAAGKLPFPALHPGLGSLRAPQGCVLCHLPRFPLLSTLLPRLALSIP